MGDHYSVKEQIRKIYEQLESEDLDSETRKLLLDKAFELSQHEIKNEQNQILD